MTAPPFGTVLYGSILSAVGGDVSSEPLRHVDLQFSITTSVMKKLCDTNYLFNEIFLFHRDYHINHQQRH